MTEYGIKLIPRVRMQAILNATNIGQGEHAQEEYTPGEGTLTDEIKSCKIIL